MCQTGPAYIFVKFRLYSSFHLHFNAMLEIVSVGVSALPSLNAHAKYTSNFIGKMLVYHIISL